MDSRMPDFGYLKYEIKEWWERLAIREWLSRSPKLVIGVSVVLVVGLIVFAIWLTLPKKVVEVENYEKDWFYDLKHRRLFVARKGQIPPIEAPSGPLSNGEPAGVRAVRKSGGKGGLSAESRMRNGCLPTAMRDGLF